MAGKLEKFERSVCDCDKCKAACMSIPGMLAPGDLDHMMMFDGITWEETSDDARREWCEDHLAASEGALVMKDGHTFRIPTIVPKQRENGSCVFFNEETRMCRVHPVAPFGCRCFNVCGKDNKDDVEKSQEALAYCSSNYAYQGKHQWLLENGHIAPPLHERVTHFEELMEEIDE